MAVAAVVVVDLDDVRGVLPVVCREEGTAGAAESSRASSSSPSSDVLPPGCESQSMSSSPSDVLPLGGESQSMSSSPSDVLPLRGESQSMSSPSSSAASSPSTPSSVGAKPGELFSPVTKLCFRRRRPGSDLRWPARLLAARCLKSEGIQKSPVSGRTSRASSAGLLRGRLAGAAS